MNKFGSIIAFSTLALLLGGCATVAEKQWASVSQTDTIGGYEHFLRGQYGDAEYDNKARMRIADLKRRNEELKRRDDELAEESAFTQAKKVADEELAAKSTFVYLEKLWPLEGYLKRYPSGKHTAEAEKLLEALRLKQAKGYRIDDYDKARESESLAAYEAFIKKYPQGPDTSELEKALPRLRKLGQAKELGETALRMGLVLKAPTRRLPNGLVEQSIGGVILDHPDTWQADMARFRALLKAGADPDLIRIEGYSQPWAERGAMGMGSPGTVVPARKGGLTLLEFCRWNKLNEAVELLKKHGGK